VIEGLGSSSESQSAANSRIKDADFAQVTAELTKAKILSESSLAILGQANQSPNLALKLLG
jgi:flagellin